MLRFISHTRRLVALVIVFCLLLVSLIWGQLLRQLSREKEEAIVMAVQRNSNLAVSLEQYAIRTIRNADAFLQLVKMEYEKKGNAIAFDELLNKGIIDINHFHSVAVFDRVGKLRASNIYNLSGQNLNFADREHFFFHKEKREQLYISKPFVSRTIGKAVIVLSRRLELKDGTFSGTVAVQIEPSTFTQFYSRANLNEHDIISLISPNGVTYARRTGNVESFGEDIRKSPLFRHLALSPVNNYYAKDAIRGIPTYFSYRKLADYPMIATVGTSEKDVLATYNTRLKREYIFGSIISFLLGGFGFLICFILVRSKEVNRMIRISEKRFRSIFENSQDGIILMQPDGTIEAMNEAASRLFAGEKGAGQLFSNLIENSGGIGAVTEGANGSFSEKEERLFTPPGGRRFTAEIVYSQYREGEEKRRVALVRDISMRKEMEQHLVNEQKKYQRKLTKQIILAQEREREAIGHEMHDNVNQILTTIKLYLEMAKDHPSMRDDLLPKSIELILSCINEIRNLSRELSAPTLGTQSLVDSVKALVEMVSASSGLTICFEYSKYATSLHKDQKLAIYGILQEQLNNIIKHAGATEIKIVISQCPDATELRVIDNGKGFDTGASRKGIGLNNILSRAKVFGGEMQIESGMGRGTMLRVCIPILAELNDREETVPTLYNGKG